MGKYTPNDLDPGAYKPGSLREQKEAVCDLCDGKTPVGDAVVCDGCGRAYLSAVALPDELEVVANLRSDAAQLLRMSEATKFGEDLSVRVKKPDLLISNMIAAADALSQAHSTIAALRKKLEAAERNRDAGVKNLLTMQGAANKLRQRAETAEAELKRLTEEKAGAIANLEALHKKIDGIPKGFVEECYIEPRADEEERWLFYFGHTVVARLRGYHIVPSQRFLGLQTTLIDIEKRLMNAQPTIGEASNAPFIDNNIDPVLALLKKYLGESSCQHQVKNDQAS